MHEGVQGHYCDVRGCVLVQIGSFMHEGVQVVSWGLDMQCESYGFSK